MSINSKFICGAVKYANNAIKNKITEYISTIMIFFIYLMQQNPNIIDVDKVVTFDKQSTQTIIYQN